MRRRPSHQVLPSSPTVSNEACAPLCVVVARGSRACSAQRRVKCCTCSVQQPAQPIPSEIPILVCISPLPVCFADGGRLPDASVTHSSVQDDVRQIAAVGGGGLEFLPFYNYGLGPALTDWSIYGFGTEAFNKLFQAVLDTATALKLSFDFALGPNQGAGVPSEVETPGLAKELVYGNTTIGSGETFSGNVPEAVVNFNFLSGFMNPAEVWGSNELLAVVAGRIASEGGFGNGPYGFKIPYTTLDHDSLVDLTNITNHGTLTWTAPNGNGTWVIFAVYERYTNQRSCVSVANATTALGNGSWMVDHWSASGAKKTTDFWDQHILSDANIAALVKKAGEYGACCNP